MPDGSEFHIVGAATLKPREAKVVRTRGTDSRLVFAERRERVRVIQKGVKVSGLSGAESVMGKRRKLEVYTLFNRKPIYSFGRMCWLKEDWSKCM